ncbi:tol-pal system protein YbgF [Nitratireductor sp. XY-223]|uniref:tol-pal system protein YbgF n=1 Tax=Nitratireductor sp. XY-223 TaxID=2561926 RepID=UPI0010AA2496|nr:tol-pal system protein YbgF [Nitratireductor sp. XY-223]
MIAYSRILAACLSLTIAPGLAHAAWWANPAPAVAAPTERPLVLVQADDSTFRIGQLEEQVRILNGRIEEMNFQLLQMQEQMRQMQEDNEFRFQELENVSGERSQAEQPQTHAEQPQTQAEQPQTQDERSVVVLDPSGQSDGSQNLGSITFNENGEMVDGQPSEADAGRDQTQTAALPASDSEELYRAAYGFILSGDYPQAEAAFREYIDQYPGEPKVADAYFWLGEAQYSQGTYHEAAKTLLTAHKQYPSAAKAPEMLLKLGMSLAALDNRDTACATYREVLTRYPDASVAVKDKVAVEQSRMSC